LNPVNRTNRVGTNTTLRNLFDLYQERHAKVFKRSWRNDEWQFNKHLKSWLSRKIGSIRRADVQALHATIGSEHGHYAANRTLALLRRMFNLATGNWGYEGENPASRIQMFREQSRKRFLLPAELKQFAEALGELADETYRHLFLIMLLTGARKANACSMKWAEVDLERKLWVIPGAKTKTAEDYSIPLVPEAVEILRSRKQMTKSDYVFPGRNLGNHIKDLRYAWQSLCKAAKIEELHIHDLRRTLGSWQAATGASLPIIGRTLGHRDAQSTQVYARLDVDPVRRAMETATSAMLETAGVLKVKTQVVKVEREEKAE
jgi:integrase